MFEAWYKIDVLMLARLRQFSNWTQRQVGMTATLWCELFLVASIAAVILSPPAGKYMFTVIDGAISVIALVFLPMQRKRINSLAEKGTLVWAPQIALTHLFSIVLVFACAYQTIQRLDFWFELLTMATLFQNVPDLPAGKSKLRQAFESMGTILVPVKTNT